MRNVDFRIGGGFPELPAASTLRGDGGFSGLYRQLHGEVSQFIANGSDAGADRALVREADLSPEGVLNQLKIGESGAVPSAAQQEFLSRIAPLAEEASQRLGVAPEVLAAHAALESGWGSQPIRRGDGSDSHNLFALKAGASWRGEVTEIATTEYEHGEAVGQRASFRSYADAGQAFQDFTQLMLNNPRYRAALQTGADALAYGQALQKGGYATDPAYADKLASVAARIKGVR